MDENIPDVGRDQLEEMIKTEADLKWIFLEILDRIRKLEAKP